FNLDSHRASFVKPDIDKSWLGLEVADLPLPPADEKPRPLKARPRGVRVIKVLPDSPADRAGIKADDIITQIHYFLIGNRAGLVNILSLMQHSHPEVCDAIVLRDKESLKLKLTLTKFTTK